ncbi:MAG: uracil-DNA glycosylase [Planctomycetota bacterium]
MTTDEHRNSILPVGWPVESDWTSRLERHFQSDTFQTLLRFVEVERESQTVYPPVDEVYTAFQKTPFQDVKVVILGQDPYHGPEQAHGLSFSVTERIEKLPPSLKNIFRELADDIGCKLPSSGNLSAWAEQGVLLLNTVLTVRQGAANSHRKKGWELFVDDVILQLSEQDQKIVFVLWGRPSETKASIIGKQHATIISPHPSPLSAHRGFFGSKPFSRANAILTEAGRTPIDWEIISNPS